MKLALKLLVVLTLLPGCMSAYLKSVGGRSDEPVSKIFITEYNLAWESAIEALKTSPMEVVNRENGSLQTKWIDNTAERNFIDSVGSVNPYLKAQYRFRVMLAKGVYEGRASVRASVQKEQQVQRDVLEGWVNLPTDGIQENSLLYRIGRVIENKGRIQDLDNEKMRKQLEDAKRKK